MHRSICWPGGLRSRFGSAAAIRLARCYQKGLLERPAKGKYFAPPVTEEQILKEGVVLPEVLGAAEEGDAEATG